MQKLFISLLLMLFIHSSSAQVFHRNDNQDRLVILSPGLSSQGNGNFYAELNFMLARLLPSDIYMPPLIFGPRIGLETNFSNSELVFAPKIGWEASFIILGVRLNGISYIDKGNVDFRILPEIGLSFFSGINLFYGYNIPLLNYILIYGKSLDELFHHSI